MGRYSRRLATPFADAAGVRPGQRALDVGCGPGALTGELVRRLGPTAVMACDPSTTFVAACSSRHPGVDVRQAAAEQLPFPDACVDRALAQLVFHFVADPPAGAAELRRVVRPGGLGAACGWDFAGGMAMLRHFGDAASTVDPRAPDEARTMRFGRRGELVEFFVAAGFVEATESTLEVSSTYADFDELWSGFLAGVGPAGVYCSALTEDQRSRVRAELFRRVGAPVGELTLGAVARCATGVVPA
jgi:SAM-dependent methyltransferase